MSGPSSKAQPLQQPAASVADDGDPEYESDADEDFSPDAEPAVADHEASSESSSDSGDGEATSTRKEPKARKRKQRDDLEVELASGDEAIIQKGKRRKQKRTPKDGKQHAAETGGDDDDGGEGGLIKTRAQSAKEKKERKPLASTDNATVDVDALWAAMSSAPVAPPSPSPRDKPDTLANGRSASTLNPTGNQLDPKGAPSIDSDRQLLAGVDAASVSHLSEDTITIERTYTFAGTTTTETKRVPAQSAEAKLYLESLDALPKGSSKPTTTSNPARRPKKRGSLFDPKAAAGGDSKGSAAPKLNTIEKSKLDWAGYVDKEEGLREELEGHGRGKEDYLGRMEFLADVEQKREEDARKVRGA